MGKIELNVTMLRFIEKKLSCQKLLRIENVNKEIILNGGFQTKISVSLEGMLIRPVQNNGELNGEVVIYRAKFTVNNNRIFAVRHLTISDSANTGLNPVNEYQIGKEHIGRIFVDENEVTLTVQNPGGTLNLVVNYTLISERPIEPEDVVTEDTNYQVAQDYIERKEDAVEVVIITDDDDNAESTWLQRRHVDKHISDFMPVIDPLDNVLHEPENMNAGKSHAEFETKKGESPSSSVLDLVHMIYIKMKMEEISVNKTYIIVKLGDKTFILTLSDSETVSHLKNRSGVWLVLKLRIWMELSCR